MQLHQAINVIMGANIGTTVTAWILSLGGIEGSSLILKLLKPDSFTPVLALIGIGFTMFSKSGKKKDVGTILLGLAVLMQGMSTMSDSVAGLADVPEFRNILLMFENPVLGVLAGAVLTAVIQSSSASVGILQALSATGAVTIGAAVPIIMGQNIGTCITAILSSFGTNRNAKRTAMVHLSFNVIGTVFWLTAFALVEAFFAPALFDQAATHASIATAHSLFNIACTCLLFPQTKLLEKLAYKLVPEGAAPSRITMLDERLLATPAVALERSHAVASEMAVSAAQALYNGISCISGFSPDLENSVREQENHTDQCEDEISNYLIRLSALQLEAGHSAQVSRLLKVVGDLERIGDHAVNLAESGKELAEKKTAFSDSARAELKNMTDAVQEIMELTCRAFTAGDVQTAALVEPLEQIVDDLKDALRSSHVRRLQTGDCTIESGFIWLDVLTDLERIADHCSNIAASVLEDQDIHGVAQNYRSHSDSYGKAYIGYAAKYLNR
ncbi:MAG: Na/Pi cotransporter family protein, partial [Oscillospiraceae bacterium]|nr:Na/Pi cotransporter family protein [Oscillospiraceae bacterium]